MGISASLNICVSLQPAPDIIDVDVRVKNHCIISQLPSYLPEVRGLKSSLKFSIQRLAQQFYFFKKFQFL